MPAARRAPRAVTAAVAACALSLLSAAPGVARPAGHGPARPCIGCHAHRTSVAKATPIAPDGEDGATTLALVLVAGGALLAGGGAGYAGGRRRVAVR